MALSHRLLIPLPAIREPDRRSPLFSGDLYHFRDLAGFRLGSIVYLAAITGINPQLYEAARIDGANKFRQIWHVTLPGMLPIIVIMFIMAVGGLMNVGWEKLPDSVSGHL